MLLLPGRIWWKRWRRDHPRSPEIMLFRHLGAVGGWRLTLHGRCAWLLHPTRKDTIFVAAPPSLLAAVAAVQRPSSQRGQQDLNLDFWK